MSGGLLAASAEYLRSREFIERLTLARMVSRRAVMEGGRGLTDAELAEHLDLDPAIAGILFAFLEAWDLSEAALAEIATHLSPKQGEIRH
ncbi:hypothetical protein NKH53_23240 [Mesorhizobium australicum]|uniref:hypothetical protein n=1 Tax=Mesorhizobium australicum TaxID=536018 RepID=UPI00333D9BD8